MVGILIGVLGCGSDGEPSKASGPKSGGGGGGSKGGADGGSDSGAATGGSHAGGSGGIAGDGGSAGSSACGAGGLPAVPCAYGFGMETRAAYGCGVEPTVYRVNTLSDDASVSQNSDGTYSGSLRGALGATEPRIVVFEISGTIELQSDLIIDSPCITVAGQTAPSPGILIKNYGIWIDTHDALVQHLRVRPGWDPDVQNCNLGILAGYPGPDDYNIVLDHLSVSWSAGKTYTFGDYSTFRDVSIWRSISAEGLYQPYAEWNNDGQQDKCGSSAPSAAYGMLYVHTKRASIIQSIFKDHLERNPAIGGSTTMFLANNVIHNFGQGATLGGPWPLGPGQATVVSNVFRYSQDSENGLVSVYSSDENPVSGMAEVFVSDNKKDLKTPGTDLRDAVIWTWDPEACGGYCFADYPTVAARPIDLPNYPVMAAEKTRDFVLANAGARPVDRALELVDQGIIADVANGNDFRFVPAGDNVRGIPEEYPHGGYPSLAENERSLNLPTNPHADDDGDGYTNLEEWLHAHASAVEVPGTAPPP